ncbi:MAG: hypothetical protein WAM69_18855 [Candidatus Sulfotelmatobacter sp.]
MNRANSSLPRGTLFIAMAIAITVTVLGLTLHAPAQELAKRLILKDGSYQLVTKYEIKGDRVRYMSAERNEWEELPTSLVDWPATEKYEKERTAAAAIPEAAVLDKETDADRAAEEAHLPQVAPGLRLPEDSGVFLLDNFQGQPQLVEIQQAESDINSNTKLNILRGIIPVGGGAKLSVELEGEHAAVHAHVGLPSIYIKVEDELPVNARPTGETASAQPSQPSLDAPRSQPEQPEQPEQAEQAVVPFDRFHIVRARAKGGNRIVGNLRRNVTGKVSPEESYVKTTIDRVGGGWLRLTPTADLAPGEYAVVETEANEGMNLYVWDFGVNPKAPANANPWKPEAKTAEPQKP